MFKMKIRLFVALAVVVSGAFAAPVRVNPETTIVQNIRFDKS
jgi:hypothetical protein